jgi:predicted RNA methylase
MCEVKLAYYPTDPKTLKIVIDRFLRFSKASTTFVVDPCCATGEAVNVFNDCCNANTYGIELDEQRAKEASERLDKTLNADAIYGVRKSNDWAGVLFLNPPYGTTVHKDRLEQEFVEKYAPCVVNGGVMILVINPSSATDKMAKTLMYNGFKPIASVFDPSNDDYNNYRQFFIVLQKIDKSYRCELMEMYKAVLNPPVSIDECREIEPIAVANGNAPKLFKENELPIWKFNELLAKSKLHKRFEALMKPNFAGRTSIEEPNEGQAALLLASGVLNQPIGDWIVKGQVAKVPVETEECDPETGEPTNVVVRDTYKTVLFGFNRLTLEIARLEYIS